MSNRSLMEFNHDFSSEIERNPDDFVKALRTYLGSASPENAARLRGYGVRIFGMRHHSDGFKIDWGGQSTDERGRTG